MSINEMICKIGHCAELFCHCMFTLEFVCMHIRVYMYLCAHIHKSTDAAISIIPTFQTVIRRGGIRNV